MGTRKRATGQDIVQDAEHVLTKLALPRVQAALKKVNKGRKVPLLPAAFVKEQRGNLAALRHRLGGQSTIGAKKKAASVAEAAARATLAKVLLPIRDAVLLTPGLSAQNAVAFLRGRDVRKDSTPSLLTAAGAVLDAAKGTAGRAALKDAGIAPATMTRLGKLRDALAAADTSQSAAMGVGREGSTETRKARSAVLKGTAAIRRVMTHALREEPALLRQFAATGQRYTPKKRAPRGGGAPPSPAT